MRFPQKLLVLCHPVTLLMGLRYLRGELQIQIEERIHRKVRKQKAAITIVYHVGIRMNVK